MNTSMFNLTSFQSVAVVANNYTNGILFTGGLIMFFIIMIMVLLKSGEPLENVLAVSSWSIFVIGTIFWFAKLLSPSIPLFFLMIAAFSTLYLYASKS